MTVCLYSFPSHPANKAHFLKQIIFSCVTRPALPYFSTSIKKKERFSGKCVEHKMCFDFLCNFCLKQFSF